GLGFGYNRIGWVPLAPGEPFYPWYGSGFYGRRNVFVDNSVHITNITNVTNVYRNARVNGGVSAVDTQDFGRRSIVNPERVNASQIGTAGQIRGLIPVAPSSNSLRVSDREVRAGSVPRSTGREERFFTQRQPAPLERVPFNEQQQQMARSFRGRGGDGAAAPAASPAAAAPADSRRSIRALSEGTSANSQTTAPAAAASGTPSGAGWRRAGEERRPGPAAAASAPTPEGSANTDRGWRRFGNRNGRALAAPADGIVVHGAEPASPGGDRNVDRGAGWRRMGEERRAAPPAAPAPSTPAPA